VGGDGGGGVGGFVCGCAHDTFPLIK